MEVLSSHFHDMLRKLQANHVVSNNIASGLHSGAAQINVGRTTVYLYQLSVVFFGLSTQLPE
jgi:hypothetical protein